MRETKHSGAKRQQINCKTTRVDERDSGEKKLEMTKQRGAKGGREGERKREREKIRAIAAFLFSSFLLLSFGYLSAPSSGRACYHARARARAVNDVHSGVGRWIGRCRDDDIGEARVNAPRGNGTARRSASLPRGAVS